MWEFKFRRDESAYAHSARSSRVRENPMREYLVMVELACDDLQQSHKAPIKKGQRLNPRCPRITCENKGYAEKRVHELSLKRRIGIPATKTIGKDIVDPRNMRDM